jgi:hypothetical protein
LAGGRFFAAVLPERGRVEPPPRAGRRFDVVARAGMRGR